MTTLVIGHRNPDTDAICSAIAYAELLRREGQSEVEAASCGEAGPRTRLRELNREQKLDLSCLLVTDLTCHDSMLLTVGSRRLIETIEYPRKDKERDLFELKGVVSRKKQLLPYLIRLLRQARRQ
jgi:inorganic pyrophosphatase/exopolyphosphatase